MHAMSKLRRVVPCCQLSSSYILSSIVHTVNSRDQRMRQVVAYKRLKTMENH